MKKRLTKGSWHVDEILKIDERACVDYFMANGNKFTTIQESDIIHSNVMVSVI